MLSVVDNAALNHFAKRSSELFQRPATVSVTVSEYCQHLFVAALWCPARVDVAVTYLKQCIGYKLIGILIHSGHLFWPYFERLSNIQPQFSPTDLARDARANPFVVAGFKWPPILHGFG